MIDRIRRMFAGRGYSLVETHISWVFLGPEDVFKLKKPVDFGFLDFRTLEKRWRACEAEVQLNRRLAGDVYLGVVPLRRDAQGNPELGGEGELIEWAVHMRRLPDADRADVRLAAGTLSHADVDRVVERISAFHASTGLDETQARFGLPEAIEANVRENFTQTRDTIGAYLEPARVDELERWQLRFLERRADLFRARVVEGWMRDGHGDLRLEHVYVDLQGEVRILDCIEFNERFRYGDGAADLAFLSMDCAFAGRIDLAERVLSSYARAAGDYDLYRVIDFYESYRAFVRAKVASMLAADAGASLETRTRAREQARRYYLLALAKARRSVLPSCLIAVGGLIASGKSTVANALDEVMSAPVIDSDRLRKQLVGRAPTDLLEGGSFEGAYAPSETDRVYAELFRRADAVLDSGRSVILDASFRTAAMRRHARALAARHGVPFFLVECLAPVPTLRARLEAREGQELVTDARADLLDDFIVRYEPFAPHEADHVLTLDTRRPLDANLRTLTDLLSPMIARQT